MSKSKTDWSTAFDDKLDWAKAMGKLIHEDKNYSDLVNALDGWLDNKVEEIKNN